MVKHSQQYFNKVCCIFLSMRAEPLYIIVIVAFMATIIFLPSANACGFVSPESIERPGTDYYYDRYDSSNWTLPENIYNPDNYDECYMLGWC